MSTSLKEGTNLLCSPPKDQSNNTIHFVRNYRKNQVSPTWTQRNWIICEDAEYQLPTIYRANRHKLILTPQNLVTSTPIATTYELLFGLHALCQVLDGTFVLTQIVHGRKSRYLGPGGLKGTEGTNGVKVSGWMLFWCFSCPCINSFSGFHSRAQNRQKNSQNNIKEELEEQPSINNHL